MKVTIIVLDSFGIGALPDAEKYGDSNSNTYRHILEHSSVELPNLISLGLNNIDGVNLRSGDTIGSFGRMQELTPAKDTTAGHYEISGLILDKPYPTFPNGFPDELIGRLEKECGVEFLGNTVASGTEIIERLGQEHIETRKPILYTSADSVLQVATHISVYSLDELYAMCEKIREICLGEYNIGRIIARPFATNENGKFYRLENRKDYALSPPSKTMLDKLKENNLDVVCIGKIEDIFNFCGVTESFHTRNNTDGIAEIITQVSRDLNGIIFANLNDTDSLYGHRNDPVGYANALKQFDNNLPNIIDNLSESDILIVTADHGCDPITNSTDHSREYVPLLVYSKSSKNCINLGTLVGFDNISKSVLDLFDIEKFEDSIFRKIGLKGE